MSILFTYILFPSILFCREPERENNLFSFFFPFTRIREREEIDMSEFKEVRSSLSGNESILQGTFF